MYWDDWPCPDCGLRGAHYCTGPKRVIDMRPLRDLFKRPQDPKKCKKHRQYKAIRRPRTACEACWRRWVYLHP